MSDHVAGATTESAGESIHLAVAFDRNYLTPFYTLVTSIFLTNRTSRFAFHCIATGLSPDEKDELARYIDRNNSQIEFYRVDEDYVRSFYVSIDARFTPAVYYRLLFASLVGSDVERLLYLDSDTVVVGDLAELYSVDLGSKPVGAVTDIQSRMPRLGIHEHGGYFNSGVLVLSIREWKAQKITEKAIDFIRRHPEQIHWVDQDALNAVLIGNWQRLQGRFNVQHAHVPRDLPSSRMADFLKDKVVVHYTYRKPWSGLCHCRLRYLYHYYRRRSPRRGGRRYSDFTVSPAYLYEFTRIRAAELLRASAVTARALPHLRALRNRARARA